MKKILLLLFLLLFTNSYSNYSTPGTGVTWDLDSLVAFSGGNVTLSGSDYMVNDTIIITAGDFTQSAVDFSNTRPIELYGKNDLLRLLKQI